MIIKLSRQYLRATVDAPDTSPWTNQRQETRMDHDLSAKDKTALQDILIQQLDITRAQATPEAKIMDDLGADSLDVVEITMKLEEHFNFSIPDEEWEKVQTVGDLYGAVASLLEQAGSLS
jgi:acyl carrier protein